MTAEVDLSELVKFTRQLGDGLASGGSRIARQNADRVAGEIRNNVPRRTGRLAASVSVTPDGDGWGVVYGASVPYASYIEKRSNTVADAVAGAETPFAEDAAELARKETRT